MSVTVADLRIYPLNNIPESDLSDETIEVSIAQATVYLNTVKRADVTDDQFDAAKIALAGYLAYLNYVDRPVSDVAGVIQNGYFTPAQGTEGIPQVRSSTATRDKLKALYESMVIFVDAISVESVNPYNKKSQYIPLIGLTTSVTDL